MQQLPYYLNQYLPIPYKVHITNFEVDSQLVLQVCLWCGVNESDTFVKVRRLCFNEVEAKLQEMVLEYNKQLLVSTQIKPRPMSWRQIRAMQGKREVLFKKMSTCVKVNCLILQSNMVPRAPLTMVPIFCSPLSSIYGKCTAVGTELLMPQDISRPSYTSLGFAVVSDWLVRTVICKLDDYVLMHFK